MDQLCRQQDWVSAFGSGHWRTVARVACDCGGRGVECALRVLLVKRHRWNAVTLETSLCWCHRVYRKWSGHKEAREHNAQSLFWVIAIKLHDLDTEEHRQGVGPKCLVPKLFERRFVSMASLDVSLVGLAWSPDFVILGGTHMESRFCQIVFRCGVHSSGRVWCILSCVWLSGCWLCDHLGVGRQALARPLPHILGEVHLRYRCVLRRRKDWHLLPSSSHCRGVLRRRRDRPSSSQCRQVLRRREGTGPPPRILEDFSPFLKCDLVLRAVPLVLTVLKPVQIHSCSSWTTLLTCSVFCLLPMSEHPWRFHRCRSWTSCCVWCRCPDSAEHPWRFHRCRSWTSCSCPLLCLVPMSRQRRTPVEIPQVPFLGQVVHARCCVWCRCPDSAEHPWRFHRCRSWTSCSCPLLCLVPMPRQRRTPRGDSTGAVLGQVVHARCCVLVRMSRQRRTPVEIPQVPFLDKLFMHVVVSGADVQTAQNPRGDSTGAVLGQVVHARCCVWCGWLDSAEPAWRFPRCRSWTSLFMHVVVSGADVQTAQNTRGDSTGAVLGQVVHARCCVWCGWPDSAEPPVEITQVPFLDKLFMHVVVSGADGQTAQNPPWRFHRCRSWTSCSCTLLCLVRMSRQRRTPVEIPQVPFLDKLFMHVVVSGADGQTAQNNRGDSTGAVLGQVVHARCCVWCGCQDSAEPPVEIPQVPFLDKLFMHVVVSGADGQTAQNTRGDSTGAVHGQVVNARCCVWCRWPDRAEPPWRFHRCRSWTSCSCTLLCLVRMARQRRTPVEIPQVPFLDKLFMHVVVSGADGQTAQNPPWRFHRCRSWTSCSCTLLCLVRMSRQRRTPRGDSTGAVLGQVVHARCCVWCGCPDSAEPPVEIPQVPFLDKLFMHVVVSGADVQTAQNHRGDSTGAVLGQVVHARCCVWCGCPDSAEPPWRFHRCRSWTSCSWTLLCLVRMARQRRTPVEIP